MRERDPFTPEHTASVRKTNAAVSLFRCSLLIFFFGGGEGKGVKENEMRGCCLLMKRTVPTGKKIEGRKSRKS